MRRGSVFLLNDTSSTGHPGCVQVVETIRRNLASRGIDLAGSWPVAMDWRLASTFHAGMRQASAFVVNGEGTIHHTADRPKARKLLQCARALKADAGRPVFLVNASMEALEPEDFECLHHFHSIYVRDERSRRYLADNGVAAQWVPDLCLAAEVQPYSERTRIVCTDSTLLPISQLLKQCSTSLQAGYAPMRPAKWRSYWRYARSDRSALLAFAARYYEVIATAQAVVTGRFHAMLFCLLAATPFLAVSSNSGKIEAVLEDVFASADRLVPTTLIAGGSAFTIPAFTPAEDGLRRGYLSAARQRAQSMFDDIAAAL